MTKTVYVLNGPNLNLLGKRQPEIYGRETLADVETLCAGTAELLDLTTVFHQSNHEGEIVDQIILVLANAVEHRPLRGLRRIATDRP